MSSDDSDDEELEKLKAKAPVCVPSASVPLRLCLYSSGFVAALDFASSLPVSSPVAFSGELLLYSLLLFTMCVFPLFKS